MKSEQAELALILFGSGGFVVRGLLEMTWKESIVRSVAAALQCLERGSYFEIGSAGMKRGRHL